MSDTPYLIAHKVRGEAAFDVAIKQTCPLCDHGLCYNETDNGPWEEYTCSECDGEGYWWICSTSGHRAYPFWHSDLLGLIDEGTGCQAMEGWLGHMMKTMPPDLPDHYAVNNRDYKPTVQDQIAGRTLAEMLGLLKPKEPIRRRV